MAQRFGRVNRYGRRPECRIDVVFPAAFEENDKLSPARKLTLALLRKLGGSASPAALRALPADERGAAFSPRPTIPTATPIHFDAWAFTTIRDALPGRQDIGPYLHGIEEWQPPETRVAWREEVKIISEKVLDRYRDELADMLEDIPLKPHELLRDTSKRVFDRLKQRVSAVGNAGEIPVWVVADDGAVKPMSLVELVRRGEEGLEGKTVLLPPAAGGLREGMLAGDAEWNEETKYGRVGRVVWEDGAKTPASRVG